MATPTLAPMLNVRRGAAAIDFYTAAFGAETRYRMDDPSGAVVAKLAVGSAGFWVADESPEHENPSPEGLGGSSVRIVLTVDDPAAVFDRAVEAGGTVVYPVQEAHGWRIGRIKDPFGHHWEIGKEL